METGLPKFQTVESTTNRGNPGTVKKKSAMRMIIASGHPLKYPETSPSMAPMLTVKNAANPAE
jgi:hypothetical protein